MMRGRRCLVPAAFFVTAAGVVGVFGCSASSSLPPGGVLPGDVNGPADGAAFDQIVDSPPSSDDGADASQPIDAGDDTLEASTE